MKKEENDNEVEYLRRNLSHPRDRFERYNKMKDIKKEDKKDVKNELEFEINTTTETPFININVPIDTTAREKRENAIMEKITNNLPDDNDKYYIEHDRETDTFTIEEDRDKDKKDDIYVCSRKETCKIDK